MDNNKNETLSILQLSILIYVFLTGSAVVVGIGGEAKQDAWIAIGISTIIGMLLFRFYLWLLESSNQKSFFSLLEASFGKWLGKSVILLYILYFFYIASRVLRDFGELLVTTIYRSTPIEIVIILLILTVAYILIKGIEVLGRTAEVFIPYTMFFIAFTGLGVLISGEFQLKNLEPVLGDGMKPIIKTIFPNLIGFPFGELIVVLLLLSKLTFKKK
ncbi:MAG: GerAB/ArcD/ProY family transporter, partial [Bacillus sp. (in: firmicutes)]